MLQQYSTIVQRLRQKLVHRREDLQEPVRQLVAQLTWFVLAVLQIMASMIEEADDVSQQLLDTILERLTPPKMDDQPQSYR